MGEFNQAGIVRAGIVRAGTVRAGIVRAGIVRAGIVRAGTVRAGTVRAGTVRAGTAAHGSLRAALAVSLCLVIVTAGCDRNRAGGGQQTNKSPSGQFEQRETTSAPQTGASGGAVSGADSTQRPAQAAPPVNAQPTPAAPAAPSAGAGQPSSKAESSKSAQDSSTTATSPPLRDPYHQPPKDTVSQVVYTGWKQYNLNCARCHGEDVGGTTLAPYLIESFRSGKVDHTEYWNVVHGSRMQKGMPNWSGVIPDSTLEAIYQYIKGRSEGKVHQGRPAVRPG